MAKSFCECVKSELDLFATPPIQKMIQSGMWEEILPVGSISHGNPIQFNVTTSADHYIDPSSTYLYVRAKITKSDGTNFADDAKIAPVNNFLGAMWKELVVELNDVKVSSSNIIYPYRSFFETLLNYGEDAKKSVLQSQMFFKDDNESMDNVVLTQTQNGPKPNNGFVQRNLFCKGCKPFEMYGRLHADIFFQNRLILNGVSMRIKLTPSNPTFCLIGDPTTCAGVKFEILHTALFIRKVMLSPDVIEGHIAAFRSGANAIYPIRRIETTQNILAGVITSQSIQSLKDGSLPKRVVIGLVENNVLNGQLSKNPFHFKHHNLKEISLSVNGVVVPYKPLSFNFENGEYIRGFHSLFTGIDRRILNTGNNIDRLDWIKGYTLFAFDLSPDLSCGDYFNLLQKGKLRLDLSFSSALNESVTVISYMEFEDQIEITEERRVLYEVS